MEAPRSGGELDTLLIQAEIDAERIVGIMRMLVAAGLALFFVTAIRPVEEVEHTVLIRQWVYAVSTMAAYFLLGFVTWRATRHGLFKRWMIWPTATADALFVVINVWVGMRNTGLMGDTTFVLPAVWLVPLVLAFGMLRVNARVMAYIAALIVAGMLTLISIDAWATHGLEDASIWLFLSPPPNLIRIAMIALAGVVLVVAARRTAVLLRQSLDVGLKNANLTRYLPAQLAQRLAEGGLAELQRGKREELAVLFIDLRGFTRLSEDMTPAGVSAFITEFRTGVSRCVDAHAGIIDKFMGDAAMILFPDERGDKTETAQQALNCAADLQTMMDDWSAQRAEAGLPPVAAGVGVHWGEVFSGVVGDDTRLEFSVFGDTVNVAARLQDLTKSEGKRILASRALVERARASQHWEKVLSTQLRGRDAPLHVMTPRPTTK